MRVRELEKRDLPVLEQWHRESGFDYPLPDLFSPSFARVLVVVDDNDVPVQALAAKNTIEMYMLMDKGWRNPRWRLEALMQGHEDMRSWLHENGHEDVNCWLPPEVEKSFGRRLEKLFYWIPARWKSYSRKTEAQRNEQRRLR